MNSHKTTSSGEGTKRSPADGSGIRASAKLQAHHLSRLAIVYVRQSTPQQVQDHKESAARQYALVNLAVEMGWPADRVQVIDEDQGHSGATAQGRHGFHRLLAEVGLDHVGIILGISTTQILAHRFGWTIPIRPAVIALAVGFSCLVGVGFGLFPARKASRLDPIEALRDE